MIDLSQPGTLARINKALAVEGINATIDRCEGGRLRGPFLYINGTNVDFTTEDDWSGFSGPHDSAMFIRVSERTVGEWVAVIRSRLISAGLE